MSVPSKILFISGIVSSLYYLYDIAYPNHFVGDMYGMEVLFRLFLLGSMALPLFIGFSMIIIGNKKHRNRLRLIGTYMSGICAIILVFMAANTGLSRHEDNVRKTYPQKSTEELIEIAIKKDDPHAIYEIIKRKDATAVPMLSQILLDQNQSAKIRIPCANALGQIGGKDARAALEKALTMDEKNRYLTDTIHYALKQTD